MSLKFYCLTFKQIFKALAALGSCHVTSSGHWVYENLRFSRILEHISENFQYFFYEILLVARSYQVIAVDIKVCLQML